MKKLKGRPKLSIDFIRKEFKRCGYVLLSNLYFNSNKQKLRYKCPNNHKHVITWGNWQQGTRCPYCSKNGRPTLEFIKSKFDECGYVLLSDKYINSYQKLNYICPQGHRHSIRWGDWYSHSQRCPTCANLKHSIEFSGPNHPQWRGGISCDPYCDAWADKQYKESIKERDGYKCLNPYCDDKVKQLTIHHIDYNKKNCKPINLITICKGCNSKANFDRDWHTAWYQAIIKNRIEIGRN